MKRVALPDSSRLDLAPVLPLRPGLKTCWLAHFVITARTAQLGLSARILGISPQALRRSLEAFSEFMGGELFLFKAAEIQLSALGQQLFAELNPVFEALDTLKAQVRAAQRAAQRLPLNGSAALPPVQPLVLGFVAGFYGEAKLVRLLRSALAPQQGLIQRKFDTPAALAHALQTQAVDMAFSPAPLDCPNALSFQGPASPFVIVSAPQPLRNWDDWSYALAPATLSLPWLARLKPAQIYLVSNLTGLLIQAALSGACAVCLPAWAIEAETRSGQLAVVALPPAPAHFSPYLSLIARESVAPFIRPLVEAGFLLSL
ncbi:MAG: hypothetical protein AB7I41_23245 [Candidatus Sericytochromatia bacterium]